MSDELVELPEGWEWTKIENISRVGTGATPLRSKAEYYDLGTVPWVTSGLLNEPFISEVSERITELAVQETNAKIFPKYTLLIAMYGEGKTRGKVSELLIDAATNQACAGLVFEGVASTVRPYIKLFLEKNYDDIRRLSSGGVQPNLNLGIVKSTDIPLPPLNEQKRIVSQIEALRERSQKAKAALEAIPELCDRFRQSVLAAAFRGDLTADWREENPDVEPASVLLERIIQSHHLAGGHKKGNAAPPTDGVHILTKKDFPETWEIVELKDACKPNRPITYGILKPGPELEKGVPYIRVADFPNDKLNLFTIRKTSFEIDQQFSRSRLEENDILLSIRGTVGRICRIPRQLVGANITQDSARLSVQKFISTDYICLMLKERSTQQRMEKATKGVAVRGINIGDVRALQIPLPPLSEQIEIVQRVRTLLQLITQVEQQHQSTQTQLDRLNQSILAKAFRGELVDQDPNDEPASVLLERIRAEREAQQPAKKSRAQGTGRKKSE